MARQYFKEMDLSDLDLTGFSDDTVTAIAKYFYQIRSFKQYVSQFEHDYNFCLLNKNGFSFKDDFIPFLKRYEVFTKNNFTAGYLVMQENGKIRYLVAHSNIYRFLDTAFAINGPSDMLKYMELFEESQLMDFESFKLDSTKSKFICVTNVKFHVNPDPSRALLNSGPPASVGKWRGNKSVFTLLRDQNGDLKDNLCVFRAVCVFFKVLKDRKFTARNITMQEVTDLYHDYREAEDRELPDDPSRFKGCNLETLKR